LSMEMASLPFFDDARLDGMVISFFRLMKLRI